MHSCTHWIGHEQAGRMLLDVPLGCMGDGKIIQPRQKSSPQAMNLERWARIFWVVGWNVPLRLRYMQLGCVCYLSAY